MKAPLVLTKSSAKAFHIVRALSDSRPRAPRLLLLCGPPGVGKTELLRLAVHRFRARKPDAAIVETDGERLVEEMIDALQRDAMGGFRRHVTHADLIVIDDLHTFRGKPRTQTEVAALLRASLDRGARIVCAVGSASEVPMLAAAIQRMSGARIVSLPPVPSSDARRVLSAMARAQGLDLAHSTLAGLSAQTRGDLRRGLSALARLRFDRWHGAPPAEA